MTKILVTGSEGFVGRHLVGRLRGSTDADVWTLDVEGSGSQHIREPAGAFDGYDEFDRIYHLAAISNPRVCEEEKERAWTVNVDATRTILQQLDGSQRLVFTSSSHVYGWTGEGRWEESSPLQPETFYGLTKKTAEHLVTRYAEDKGYQYAVFRMFNVYGPGQPEGFLVPDVIRRAEEQDEVAVRSPHEKISPLFVEDAVDVLTAEVPQGTYNVCHECVPVAEVYKGIARVMDVTLSAQEKQEHPGTRCGENERIRPYKDAWVPLQEGLRRTINQRDH